MQAAESKEAIRGPGGRSSGNSIVFLPSDSFGKSPIQIRGGNNSVHAHGIGVMESVATSQEIKSKITHSKTNSVGSYASASQRSDKAGLPDEQDPDDAVEHEAHSQMDD